MGLTKDERTGLAAMVAGHAVIGLVYLLSHALPSRLTSARVVCAESPTPRLCALLYGEAWAAPVGPNGPRGFDPRQQGRALPREGAGASAGGGGRHLLPPPAVSLPPDRPPAPPRCPPATYRVDRLPQEPPPLPDWRWPVDLRYPPGDGPLRRHESRENTEPRRPPAPPQEPTPTKPDDEGALRRAIAEGLAGPDLPERPQPSPPPEKKTSGGRPLPERGDRQAWRERGCAWWPQ